MARARQKSRIERGRDEPRPPAVSAETRQGIVVVALFVVAFIVFLSLVHVAGALGEQIARALGVVFGWGRFAFPLVVFGWGWRLLRSRERVGPAAYLGLFLFTLSTTGLLQLFVPSGEAVTRAAAGDGGGYAGLVLAVPFVRATGIVASIIVLVALLVVSLLLLANTSLSRLAAMNPFRRFALRLKEARSTLHRATARESGPPPVSVPPGFASREIAKADGQRSGGTGREQLQIFPQRRSRSNTTLSLDLLERRVSKPTSGNIEANRETIVTTLANFGIAVEMDEVKVGPTVTQYAFRPAEGVKVSQITSLGNDLALALAAHPIRIEAPIPGKSLVGIEVPNQTVASVSLRDILESEPFVKRRSSLTLSLGKDVAGTPCVADIESMPHLLIAGATGSGKSVAIHSLVISLLYQNSPDDLKFIMVDPKKVELSVYNGIPHLAAPVIVESKKTIAALRWVVGEMDRRYDLLSGTGAKNIHAYNQSNESRLPFLVVIIDELADLMSVAAAEVEGAIIRLAQMARAVGIHLVVSTQRPSVDVITGLIKANITSRIAFAVASQMDSRTILDFAGAEKLLGRGDMLFTSSDLSKPRRIQGALVTEDEVARVVGALKGQAEPEYDPAVTEPTVNGGENGFSADGSGEDDDLLDEAKQVIFQAQKASASLLQRRLKIGYARAARILDLLEERGIIGPGDGAKPREILVAGIDSSPHGAGPAQDLPTADEPTSQPASNEEEHHDQ